MQSASQVLSPVEREATRRIALFGLADPREATGEAPADADALRGLLAAVDGESGWVDPGRAGMGPAVLAALDAAAREAVQAAAFSARHEIVAGLGSPDPHDLALRDDARIVRAICTRLSASPL